MGSAFAVVAVVSVEVVVVEVVVGCASSFSGMTGMGACRAGRGLLRRCSVGGVAEDEESVVVLVSTVPGC